jgi:hypothetical protein
MAPLSSVSAADVNHGSARPDTVEIASIQADMSGSVVDRAVNAI